MRQHNTIQLGVIFFGVLVMCIIGGCRQSESKITEPVTEPVPAVAPEPAPTAALPENAPVVKIENPSVNFGQVGPSSVHKANYAFTNSGKSALSVSNVQSTCGCSVPALTKGDQKYPIPLKEAVVFEPGETGKVEVTFTAPATKGSVTKHLYIVSNDPVTPRAELAITAEVMVKVEAAPENVTLRFDQENAGMPSITVKSLDNQAFSIKSVTVANNVITVPFDANEKKTDFVLKPVVDMNKLNQFNTGVIQIKTDHPQAGMLIVRFTAQPKYEISRPRIILQNLEPEVPIVKDVIIRSNYGTLVEIAPIGESKYGYMAVESQEQEGNNVKLMIKITPPAQDSSARRYITDELTITLKSGEELTIRCSGWFRQN
jgi:hypothetical protein